MALMSSTSARSPQFLQKGFVEVARSGPVRSSVDRCMNVRCRGINREDAGPSRRLLIAGVASLAQALPVGEVRADFEKMEALKDKDYGKSRMKVADYTTTASGLQYKDLIPGSGQEVKDGDTVVIDWDGYTIGYYGRPFEARNKSKGGAFEGGDKDFLRVKVGVHQVIPGVEEALYGMKVGGIRRLIVPVELGYPNNDFNTLGPKPTTFSGKRALSFVLKNQGLIDKTLLFDLEVIRIAS